VPVAAGIVIGIGNVSLVFSDSFSLGGIALGTIVAVGAFHLARVIAPSELRDRADAAGGTMISLGQREGDYGDADGIDDLYQDAPGGPDRRH
jgi:hypothetical protein